MNKYLYLAGAALILGACKMDDALNSTIAMNAKMDKTNSGMQQTNAGMGRTNESIHKQTLLIALGEIQKDENTFSLFPPTGMMPAGETFGKEATPTELIQVFYLWLKEVNSAQADGTGPNPDGTWPSKEVQDRKKNIKLTALEVIAGLTPQDKVDQLINEQVTATGRFESTTYEFLMLRNAFIDGILIRESLLSNTMSNPGMFEEALKYMRQLESISKLKFRDKIALKTIGMAIPDNNIELKLDPGAVKALYTTIKDKLSQLDQMYSDSTDNTVKTRVDKIKNEIDRGIAEN